MMMNKEINQLDDLARKTKRKWEELPSLVCNFLFLSYFSMCEPSIRPSTSFLFQQLIQCNASWNDRSLGEGVSLQFCVCVWVFV